MPCPTALQPYFRRAKLRDCMLHPTLAYPVVCKLLALSLLSWFRSAKGRIKTCGAFVTATHEICVRQATHISHVFLQALHVASAGLKAICSRLTCEGIEACRLACGGHGYLAASGLPSLLGSYKQSATVEGGCSRRTLGHCCELSERDRLSLERLEYRFEPIVIARQLLRVRVGS